MSVTDEYLKNNEAYASTFSGPLPIRFNVLSTSGRSVSRIQC